MARCVVVPLPAEPKLSLPGSALALSISSFERVEAGLGMDDHDVGHVADHGDGREGLVRVERHLGVEELVDRQDAGRGQQQRVAVGLGLGHDLRADIAAGARLVVDDDLLAQRLLQAGLDRPRQHVGDAARRERRHDAHRLRWIGLRASRRRQQDAEDSRTNAYALHCFLPIRGWSLAADRHPRIGDDGLAGDEGAGLAGQHDGDAADVVGLADAAQRRRLQALVEILRVVPQRAGEVGPAPGRARWC